MKPAIVKYEGKTTKEKINGRSYKAYALDYCNNELKCLYIKDETGEITGWHDFDEFDVLEDIDNVVNPETLGKAIVRYKGKSIVTKEEWERSCYWYPFLWSEDEKSRGTDLFYGQDYIAIGIGYMLYETLVYHVLTEEGYTYPYDARLFNIISDPDGILNPETGKRVFNFTVFEV
ncbi:MAG: hypothetical protein D5S00_02315 [Tindallia sp. MSAO_Bac2]|nr:MAG: hypothetical protein D5S00_02315 [Tindallia sp. MSAO_Bac2]